MTIRKKFGTAPLNTLPLLKKKPTTSDAIFGRSNFKNEIIWHYNKWTNAAKMFQKNHDVILYYVKSSEYTFNKFEGEMTKKTDRHS